MSSLLTNISLPPTKVARGQHTVPEGVAVFEFLDGDHDKLTKPPSVVKDLLEPNQLIYVYEYFISKFCRKGKTYLTTKGHTCWLESKLVAVIQEFQKDFQKKKVRLGLSIYVSECGNYRWFWLEFVDTTALPDSYTSPYDVSDYRLVLNKNHMIPPMGVVVQEMDDFNAHHLMSKIPEDVKLLLDSKKLFTDYETMVKALVDCKATRTWTDSWKTKEVLAIVKEHENRFNDQDIELVVCKRLMGTADVWKWIEIIDTNVAPSNYVSVHSIDTEKRKECSQRYHSVRHRSVVASAANAAVVVQDLVVDCTPKFSNECPSEIVELLERKGLTEEYALLSKAVQAAKSLRNFCDIWRLTEEGLISFASLDEFKASFLNKGIKLILCESVGKSGRNYWLEYVDTKANPAYNSPFDVHFATEREQQLLKHAASSKPTKKVLDGRHRIPAEGVAVEELNDKKTLTEPCTTDVQEMLEPKGLVTLYNKCMKAIANSSSTRNWGSWHSEGVAAVLKEFQNEFEEQGVKVVVCKAKPETGESFRWLEFIDTEVVQATDYVPQYDVTNWDEELETAGGYKVQFPKGVVVEKLMDRKTVVENVPPSVKALMEKKDCVDLYNALIDVLVQSVLGDSDQLSESNMKELSNTLGPKFETKGVSPYLSYRPEPGGGKPMYWIEFVDRELQPNYVAQHGIEMERLPAKGMSKEEMLVASSALATMVVEESIDILLGGLF